MIEVGLSEIVSFGAWVQSRRNQLRFNRSQFADLVGCAPVTIKKIERDERRPSLEMAQLLATHLQIPTEEQDDFLRRARGEFVPNLADPTELSLAEAQASPAPEDAPRHNLPNPTTPFFGRQQELADIAARLANPDCRLLTILAAGGMGKSRLAIAAAQAQLDQFTDGVIWVPLAPIAAAEAAKALNPLVGALADALGIAFHGRDTPEQQLFSYLRARELLLVLDNFEHLLPAVTFVGDLLSQAPDVKVLATSRERLRLQEEWLFPLGGLAWPPEATSIEAGSGFDAVRLFTQRARQVRASFSLADEYADVVRICQLAEGMPLGLELAAAWVFQLRCMEIADEIDAEIDFLATDILNIPDRHRSIRSVFSYSWERLSPAEQDVLQKLSVFRGGFDRAAAKAIAGATLPILGSLVGKSLLTLAEDGRYAIHELLRQFAAEKLAGDDLVEQETMAAHASYYIGFLRQQGFKIPGREIVTAVVALTQEIDNIRLAIRQAVRHHAQLFDQQLADGLFRLFVMHSWWEEIRSTFGLITDKLEDLYDESSQDPALYSRALLLNLVHYQFLLGLALAFLSQLTEAEQVVQHGLNRLPSTAAPTVQGAKGVGLASLGYIRYFQGDYRNALSTMQKSLACHEELENMEQVAQRLLDIFNIYLQVGAFDEAERCLAKVKKIVTAIDDRPLSSRLPNETGKLATFRGRLDEAESCFQESVVQLEAIGWRHIINFVWRERGDALRLQGDFETARAYIQRSIALARDSNTIYPATQGLWSLGNLALAEGAYETALQYFEAYRKSSTLPQEYPGGPGWALLGQGRDEEARQAFDASIRLLEHQARPIALDAIAGVAHLKARAGQLEEALALLALVRSHPSSYFESREKAHRLWDELAAELPTDLVARAEARGRDLDLQETAATLLAEG